MHLNLVHVDTRGHVLSDLGQTDVSLAAVVRTVIAKLTERHWVRHNSKLASTLHLRKKERAASRNEPMSLFEMASADTKTVRSPRLMSFRYFLFSTRMKKAK